MYSFYLGLKVRWPCGSFLRSSIAISSRKYVLFCTLPCLITREHHSAQRSGPLDFFLGPTSRDDDGTSTATMTRDRVHNDFSHHPPTPNTFSTVVFLHGHVSKRGKWFWKPNRPVWYSNTLVRMASNLADWGGHIFRTLCFFLRWWSIRDFTYIIFDGNALSIFNLNRAFSIYTHIYIYYSHISQSNFIVINCWYTSSTAQGGGGSFKNRKPTGEVGCCESRVAERIHWWTDRWLELCFLEWLQWLRWSPYHSCWM